MSEINSHVWAFDLGKASIGEAVRQGNTFLHKAALLIPEKFADTKPAANRRRMWRTREAREAREAWLEKIWEAAGQEVLRGRQVRKDGNGKWALPLIGDERLEREFAKEGDETSYTSCLLRIKLLRDEKLEPWQIYKALRSAIQKRGYDPKIAWAEKEARRAGKSIEELEKEEAKKDPKYVEALNKWRQFKQDVPAEFHFPCYFDAWKMGLWNPAKPAELKPRINHGAESTRNVRFDREDVEREIKQLTAQADRLFRGKLENTRKRLLDEFKAVRLQRVHAINDRRKAKNATLPPEKQKRLLAEPSFERLAANVADFLCYGPTGVPYGSFNPEVRKDTAVRQGSQDDWMGALGQKIPRFDNRILDDCVLIPRFHVCKADIRLDKKTAQPFADSLLAAEVTFLMKLKNTLVADGSGQRKLRVEEVRQIFNTASTDVAKIQPDAKDWPRKVAECFKLTKSDWGKTKGIKELELRPLPNHEEVKAPKDSGRSRFSRPALRLLRELILSGKSPTEFHAEQVAKLNGDGDPTKGLVPGDLKFLRDMGESWDKIHIPAQKLDALASRHTEDGKLNHDAAILDLLGGINDPVVRHRLSVFAERLRTFRKQFGMPGQIVLEFVREDFMGEVRKRELLNFQREREKSRKEAREKAAEAGAGERSAPLKYELWKAQGGICLYTGKSLPFTNLDNYCIEHIVPSNHRSRIIGPDAMVNYVLTTHEVNDAKGDRTPFEWFHEDMPGEWDAYVQRVKSRATDLRNKKVQLLVQENAPELAERYTALAETAWVAKLAQTIVSLMFGWTNGCNTDGVRCVTIVSGGLTARIRRKYRLNSLLNPCPTGEEQLLWEEKCEKNREDHRHHALDAMVISFIPGWARDQSKEHFFRFPAAFRDSNGRENYQAVQQFFKEHIDSVVPENLCFLRPALDQTIYGARRNGSGVVAAKRERLLDLGFKSPAPGKLVFNFPTLHKGVENICDKRTKERVADFVASNPDEAAWRKFCVEFKQTRKDGTAGARIEFITLVVGDIEEYSDLSKDGNGAWRRGATHCGFLVALDGDHAGTVRPVYAFEPLSRAKSEFRERVGAGARVMFLESGCPVSLAKTNPEATPEMRPGRYIFTSISNKRTIKFRDAKGQACRSSVKSAVAAGLQRL